MDLAVKCRLCAEFCSKEENHVFENDQDALLELVSKYTSINITLEDFLPQNICEQCRATIKTFDDFVLRCKDTQIVLIALYESSQTHEAAEPIKIEVKHEDTDLDNLERIIKTEAEDFFDDGCDINGDDFCDEDFLPLMNNISKKRKSSRLAGTGSKAKKAKIKDGRKTKIKVAKQKKTDKIKELPIEKKKKEKKEPKPSMFEESYLMQSAFYNFSCHVCQEKFDRFPELQKHTSATHSEQAKVLCTSCSKYLRLKKQLLYHLLKHVPSFGIKCPSCPRKFVTDKYLAQHLETHTVENKCPECSKVFNTRIGLRMHLKSHTPVELRANYPCDVCHSKFLNKTAVQIHKNAVHDNYKPFICDECGKNFVTNGAMRSHQVMHRNEHKFICPQCPKKFKVKSHLKRHVDYHNGVSFKCPECPSIFNTKRTLTTHFMTHRDVYKYVCGYCGKKFKWRGSFKTHINNHTGATPYQCDWCPKVFPDNSNCRIHKRRRHPVELAEQDAKRAAENPKAERKATSIVREIKVKDPSMDDVIVFPLINDKPSDGKNDGNSSDIETNSRESVLTIDTAVSPTNN